VWAFLEKMRDDILNEMERQKVTIDADRLTRVSLLKRAVLKRCVYGVDLNAMAVELAKVSLWLDAFTLGAPLNFLDHHLKHGNSLIGARIAEVEKALEGSVTLFSQNKFAGVMMASDFMQQDSYPSHNTIEQTRQSAQAYRDASDRLAPYKRVMDVYTSRWFGNTPSKDKHGKNDFDPTIEFLRRDDTHEWLADPCNPHSRLPDNDYMQAGLVAKIAMKAAEEKCFFHWELEFPEVFFAPSKPGGQDVQLRKDGGFDAVVGNPPWGAKENLLTQQDYDYLRLLGVDNLNYYPYFMAIWILLTQNGCGFGMVLPDSLLVKEYPLTREHFLKFHSLRDVIHISKSFEDVDHDVVIVIVSAKNYKGKYVHKKIVPVKKENIEEVPSSIIPLLFWNDAIFEYRYNLLLNESLQKLSKKLYQNSDIYEKVCETHEGIHTRLRRADIFPKQVEKLTALHKLVLISERSGDIVNRYFLECGGRYVNYDQTLCTPNSKNMTPDLVSEKWFTQPKLIIVRTGEQFRTCVDRSNHYLSNNLFSSFYVDKSRNNPEYEYLCALLNSNLLQRSLRLRIVPRFGDLYVETKIKHLNLLPIKQITFTTPTDERERLTREAIDAYDIGNNANVLRRVQAYIDSNKADVCMTCWCIWPSA